MKVTTAVSKAIALAEAIRDYWEAELPKRHPNYPLVGPDDDPGPPPPEEKKLRQFLARLPEEVLFKVALVAYLGRGDYETNNLAADYQALRDDFDGPSELISQLLEKASLADYLTEGMTILKKEGLDLDKIELATAKAGKG